MKTTFTTLCLLFLTAGSASADVIPSFTSGHGPNEFVKQYSLQNFQIASATHALRGIGIVDSGSIEINEATNELRLHLDRNLNCPAGAVCLAVMPTSTTITLPIRHLDRNICGGLTIVAERNLQLVEGGLTRVEVQDLNGSRCGRNDSLLAVMKNVKVMVTEQGSEDRSEVLSVMSGISAQ